MEDAGEVELQIPIFWIFVLVARGVRYDTYVYAVPVRGFLLDLVLAWAGNAAPEGAQLLAEAEETAGMIPLVELCGAWPAWSAD